MGAENLKMMKEQIVNCVQGQLGDISKVDTHELGQAIDMIKDLAEAIYYCTVTESMEKIEDKEQQSSVRSINYYTTNGVPYSKMPYIKPLKAPLRSRAYSSSFRRNRPSRAHLLRQARP